MDTTPPLIAHMERYLGCIERGSRYDAKSGSGVQVVFFPNQPNIGALTLSTLGLNRHVLHQASGESIRIELLLCAQRRFEERELDVFLHILAEDILNTHHCPARGAITQAAGAVFAGSSLEAFYFAHAAYFPEELEIFKGSDPQTIFVWAIPITAAEVTFIQEHGWRQFEDLIERENPDLLDWERESLIPGKAD